MGALCTGGIDTRPAHAGKEFYSTCRTPGVAHHAHIWFQACEEQGLRRGTSASKMAKCAPRAQQLSIFGGCSSCSTCSSRLETSWLKRGSSAPHPMDEPGAKVAASGKAPEQPPQSQRPSAFWSMTCELSAEEIAFMMPELQSAAARFLAQKSNGGTEDVLQVVAFFAGCADQSTSALLPAPDDSEDEPSTISTSPAKAHTGNMRLSAALIFTGKGRVKSSVKRSVQSLLKAGDDKKAPSAFALQLTSTLSPVTARSCLSLLQNSTDVLPVWADSTFSDLGAYLVRRASEENDASFARTMQLGLDLLGPRKRTAQPTVQLPLKLLKGPSSSTQQDQPAGSGEPPPSSASSASFTSSDSSDRLATLLAWDGELVPEIAKERALQLMSFLHKTTEELHVAKLQLQFHKDRDALNAQVRALNPLLSTTCSQPLARWLCTAFEERKARGRHEEGQHAGRRAHA